MSGTPAMTASEADLGARAGFLHRSRLVGPRPRAAVVAAEHRFAAGAPGGALPKKRSTLLRQHHMAWLAGLALSDRQRAGIRVEVADLQPDQLAITTSGLQPAAYQQAEVGITRIQHPLSLRDRQIPHARHVELLERSEPAA